MFNFNLLQKFRRAAANDIGIDLGTGNTLVYARGYGVVMSEPTVAAINRKTGQIVAVGRAAKEMSGRTPGYIEVVRPLVGGVISDFEVAEEMLAYFINQANKISKKFARARVVISVPSGITNVEARAARDAVKSAGAREVHIAEGPMAAAIGIRLPVNDPVGSMVVDIGAGTTDIAVISLGGIVKSKNLRIAGDSIDNDIIAHIRNEFKILIGVKTAEEIKIAVGSAVKGGEPLEAELRGRDLVTGLPRQVVVTDADVREAIGSSVAALTEAVKEVLEETPPEVLGDIMRRGIILVGGGALLRGLDEAMMAELKIPVHIADDPLSCAARGAGIILEDVEKYREAFLSDDDDLPPQ